MPYNDQLELKQRPFSERFKDVWDHPTPFGLIAYIKALTEAAQAIPGAIDASRIVTGRPPSTEEEAERYNQARDYLPRAAFQIASAVAPTAPRIAGGIPIKPGGNAFSQPPFPGMRPQSPGYPFDKPPAVLGPGVSRDSARQAVDEFTSPVTEIPWWLRALLPPTGMTATLGAQLPGGAVLRQTLSPELTGASRSFRTPNLRSEFQAPETPPSNPFGTPNATGGGRLPPSILGAGGLPDPNYRELRRVSASATDEDPSGADADGLPSSQVPSPSLVPDQQPPESTLEADTGGNGSGGTGGNIGSGGNKADRDKECNQDWQDEVHFHCPQFGRFDATYQRQCKDRALKRLRACLRDQSEPPKYEWEDVARENLEGLRLWQKKQARARKAKAKKKK